MKKVLILGAGLVAKPIIEYLLEKGILLTVASPMKDRADMMIAGNPNGTPVDWSMDDPAMLDRMVSEHDLTVSLLPYTFHTDVARVCLKHRKHLVTTSYVQKEMEKLDPEAREAGLLFLNESGLDPGIDHMTAMKIIDHIHGKGGNILEFYSICGALPAPEAVDNPLGYKFSWSPRGVLLASRNNAVFLKKGKMVSIDSPDLFKARFTYDFPGVGPLEVYPNRDSVSYLEIYGIPEAQTIYRGTFRYRGWCEVLDAMKTLKMLDDTVIDYTGMAFRDFLAERAGVDKSRLAVNVAQRLGVGTDSVPMDAFRYLGFLEDGNMGVQMTTPFEITSEAMIGKMLMGEKDRDMVALQHVFLASWPGGRKEVIKSSMLDFGSPETNTAIARTVALPAAIAVRLILEGAISATGVLRPVIPEIYDPVLAELKTLGIEMKEEYGLPEEDMID